MLSIPAIVKDGARKTKTVTICIVYRNGRKNPNHPTYSAYDGHGHLRKNRRYDGARFTGVEHCSFCKKRREFVSAKEQWELYGSKGKPRIFSPVNIARCSTCGREPGKKKSR